MTKYTATFTLQQPLKLTRCRPAWQSFELSSELREFLARRTARTAAPVLKAPLPLLARPVYARPSYAARSRSAQFSRASSSAQEAGEAGAR